MNNLHRLLIIAAGIGVGSIIAPFLTSSDEANATIPNLPTITYDMVTPDGQANGVLRAPDFSAITFGNLGRFSEPGFITHEHDAYAGYGLGRQWQAGNSVADILKLGDLEESFGLGKLTLGEIVTKSGRHSHLATLDRIGFMDTQTVGTFLKANPQLLDRPIETIPPLADLARLVYNQRSPSILKMPARVLISQDSYPNQLSLNKTNYKLKSKKYIALTETPETETPDTETPKIDFSEFEMGNLDLGEYTIGDVEGLGDTFVEEFEGWRDEFLSEFEDILDISLADFPNPAATLLAFVSRVDTIWSDAHGEIKRGHSVTGSNVSGYAVPCGRECAHIELDDIENAGRDIRWISEGRRWMLGNDPANGNICPTAPWGVEGGEGPLAALNCGMEPTGRNPFGDTFKVALWSVDEITDTAETAIFFRFCKKAPVYLGCTPYFIGPIPFLPANREDWIILGPGI